MKITFTDTEIPQQWPVNATKQNMPYSVYRITHIKSFASIFDFVGTDINDMRFQWKQKRNDSFFSLWNSMKVLLLSTRSYDVLIEFQMKIINSFLQKKTHIKLWHKKLSPQEAHHYAFTCQRCTPKYSEINNPTPSSYVIDIKFEYIWQIHCEAYWFS